MWRRGLQGCESAWCWMEMISGLENTRNYLVNVYNFTQFNSTMQTSVYEQKRRNTGNDSLTIQIHNAVTFITTESIRNNGTVDSNMSLCNNIIKWVTHGATYIETTQWNEDELPYQYKFHIKVGMWIYVYASKVQQRLRAFTIGILPSYPDRL